MTRAVSIAIKVKGTQVSLSISSLTHSSKRSATALGQGRLDRKTMNTMTKSTVPLSSIFAYSAIIERKRSRAFSKRSSKSMGKQPGLRK